MDNAPVPAPAPATVKAPAAAPATVKAPAAAPVDVQNDAVLEKEEAVVPVPPPVEVKAEESKLPLAMVPPPVEGKADESKLPLAVVEKTPADTVKKESSEGSIGRDIALAELEDGKKLSYVKAWEDSEKTKVENKAQKKLSNVYTWENGKNASLEAKLKKYEEELDKKKAQYAETMRNKIAMVHKEAEEKRAMAKAIHGEELLKAEELAAKYRATGQAPKKLLGCF